MSVLDELEALNKDLNDIKLASEGDRVKRSTH